MAPTIIITSATAAQTPSPLIPPFLNPETIRHTSETMDSSTTTAVTTMCMIS